MTATFYLGTQAITWQRTLDVPLFISRRRLFDVKRLHRSVVPWALDSGGFTELRDHGSWGRLSPVEYVAEVRRYADEIGMLDWAAPQDWMCEPSILARTGLDVRQHQALTVDNYLRLRDLDASLSFIPVIQGWTLDDYRVCVDLYERAGIDLAGEATVGIGSVCRRHSDAAIGRIVRAFADDFRVHAFGVRGVAYQRLAHVLSSADSMSWTYNAWKDGPQPGCDHQRCSWCPKYALRWRERLLAGVHPELW